MESDTQSWYRDHPSQLPLQPPHHSQESYHHHHALHSFKREVHEEPLDPSENIEGSNGIVIHPNMTQHLQIEQQIESEATHTMHSKPTILDSQPQMESQQPERDSHSFMESQQPESESHSFMESRACYQPHSVIQPHGTETTDRHADSELDSHTIDPHGAMGTESGIPAHDDTQRVLGVSSCAHDEEGRALQERHDPIENPSLEHADNAGHTEDRAPEHGSLAGRPPEPSPHHEYHSGQDPPHGEPHQEGLLPPDEVDVYLNQLNHRDSLYYPLQPYQHPSH
ncbi:unnamed protein product, partial [Meganyctiphanes norvegica]